MRGIDCTVCMCSNEARIDTFMKIINLNFYVKEFPKLNHYYRIIFNDVLISQCTHEAFKSVRELGLPKTEIKVKNYYIFRGKFMWQ